jgi:rhodanese-related sulfurtransferase
MSTGELNARLGEANLVILDVRSEGHWDQSSHKVPGSERAEFWNVAQWANNYPKKKPIVLYCA